MTDRRFSSKRYVRVVGLVFAVAALTIWTVKSMPGLGDWLAQAKSSSSNQEISPLAAQSKESLSARLSELDVQITSLKRQVSASPKNKQLLAQLNAAQTEYNQISNYMGGDKAAPRRDAADNASLEQAIKSVKKQLRQDPENQALRERLRLLTASLRGEPLQRDGITPMSAPSAPTGCTATATSFTNNTPVAIPTGPAVVTSTLLVSGVGTYLHDVDLTTFMPHTFAADLDVTLTSPAGTVVTLTTDNGAGNDDVFNGTVWDDDANPAGQVPYATNNGLVTDHAYVNLTLASPLVPEEAMSAFRGEDPNGTWTITISDDLAGDGGSLDSWTLDLSTLPSAPAQVTTAFTNSTPVAIPTGPAVVTSTLLVSGAATYLNNLTLSTNMPHTFAADLDVTLTSPAGTVVTLTTDNGAGNDNVFDGTLWDDDANPAGQVPYVTNNGLVTDHAYVNLTLASPLVPEEAMGAFIGEDPNGTWTITISDDLAGDGGSLDTWTLNVTTGSCAAGCTLTCPANITVSNDPNQCGAVVNYPPPTASAGCGTQTCTPPSGSFFPVGTTTVTCTDTPSASTCSFTVTVNDTQPPTITCPTDVTAVGGVGGTVVTFSPPTASDNCPGVTAACVPPSGSTFPPGSTSVTCTATDAAGNTATCSFNVVVFDVCLQDSSNPTKVLLINSMTGEYRFCCGTTSVSGIGKVTVKAGIVTLEHNAPDRRVLGKSSAGKGSASLQLPPGSIFCTISDNTAGNGTCACAAPPPPPPAPPAG